MFILNSVFERKQFFKMQFIFSFDAMCMLSTCQGRGRKGNGNRKKNLVR